MVNSGRIGFKQATPVCFTSSNSRHTVDTRVGVIKSGRMGGKQLKYTRVINSGHMGW